jgi:hypothetical protein
MWYLLMQINIYLHVLFCFVEARINKLIFSSPFVCPLVNAVQTISLRDGCSCCQDGITDPINSACQRYKNGIDKIFNDGLITVNMISNDGSINVITVAYAFHNSN